MIHHLCQALGNEDKMSQNDIEIWSLDFKHQEKPDELALFCYIIQNEKKAEEREEKAFGLA